MKVGFLTEGGKRMFTRRHYHTMAQVIKEESKRAHTNESIGGNENALAVDVALRNLCRKMGDMFQRDNVNFNRQSFYEDTGLWQIKREPKPLPSQGSRSRSK